VRTFIPRFLEGVTHDGDGFLFVMFSNQLKSPDLLLVVPVLFFKCHQVLAAVKLRIPLL